MEDQHDSVCGSTTTGSHDENHSTMSFGDEEKKQGPCDTSKDRHNEDHKNKQQIAKIRNMSVKDTIYRTLTRCDYSRRFLDDIHKEGVYLESKGLDVCLFRQNVKRGIEIFLKNAEQHNISILRNLDWFLEQLYDICVNSNPYNYKTITLPKANMKFRPLSSVVSKKTEVDDSGEDVDIISNAVAIHGGIVTYSPSAMRVCCTTTDGGCHIVHSPSPITDMARIGKETVIATVPFRKKLLIINPSSCQMRTLHYGFNKISHVKYCRFVGLEMFSNIIYLVDWDSNIVENKFTLTHVPTNMSVGPQNHLLVTFANLNTITCYNLNGQQLFQLYCHSVDIPTDLTVYNAYFYIVQGSYIYKISSTGGISRREIGMKARYISLGTDCIFLIDYSGVMHTIRTSKDFWPRLSYFNQVRTPCLNNVVDIDDPYDIREILPMSTSSMLVIYRDLKAIIFTINGKEILKTFLPFNFQPSVFCRVDSSIFLVLFSKKMKLQYITCPVDGSVLTKGQEIDVHADYIQLCHIVSNRCLALTIGENKEVHILLIEEDKVVIENKISLEHDNVIIAATPINFVVVDKREHKLIFYSSFGEVLFKKYLDFNGEPRHIYSDKLYFYVIFKRESIVICYNIYGEVKWQLQLESTAHSHIAVFQGTISVVDRHLKRILFYKYHEWSSCLLHLENPYIRHLNIRPKENKNNQFLITAMCHLPNGQFVVSDINNCCLLYISKEGDVVSTLSLPSLATDICRWDCNEMGVTLPLEKELRVIGNLSERVRIVSLRHPYVRVRKLGECRIVCLCDKPYLLDIVSIGKHSQGEVISTVKIPFVVKSLATDNETLQVLIVAQNKVFVYDTSSEMVPTVLLSKVKPRPNLFGGCIDKMCLYLIDDIRMFAVNGHNLVVRDHVTRKQLNMSIDLVDVFSRNICVSEMLSSTLYLQDLTVSDKARHVVVPPCFRDTRPVYIGWLVIITENNLIAVYDRGDKNIKIFTFEGGLVDSIPLNVDPERVCRWRSNTLVITTGETHQLFTLKVEFPLSLVSYQTEDVYRGIGCLSDNLLVCSSSRRSRSSGGSGRYKPTLSVIDIDETHSSLCVKKEIDIVETLRDIYGGGDIVESVLRDRYGGDVGDISDVVVNANDVIIVNCGHYILFFNSNGECLHLVRHYMSGIVHCITIDDTYLYISGEWTDGVSGSGGGRRIVCLSQTGEYQRIFLNRRLNKGGVDFPNINCNGPRFIGHTYRLLYTDRRVVGYLYVEGVFKLNRERFPVCRLQTDRYPVQVKDIDLSDDGDTVVCETANTGNVKVFHSDGELLWHTDVGTSVGGVCFSGERSIMVTVPDRRQIAQLNLHDLVDRKVWQSEVPYGVIRWRVGDTYWCVHINLTECHTIQIDGNQLKVLERVSLLKLPEHGSLLKLPSVLHFPPAITSQMNSGGGGGRRSGEIVGKGRLKVRRGNYMVSGMFGCDKLSVRRLPHRTAMFPLSPTTWDDVPITDKDIISDSKLIMLRDNVAVLMCGDTLTLTTTEGRVLRHTQLPRPPDDICRWTDECFIVVSGRDEQLRFFNGDLSHLKTFNTGKYYNRIYKKNDNQLVCGGHGHVGGSPRERSCSYVDIVDIHSETCQYSRELWSGMDERVLSIIVTDGKDVVFVRKEGVRSNIYVVCWYREDSVRSMDIPHRPLSLYHRPHLTTHGDYVYISDIDNSIYQISGDGEPQLILSVDDNEVSIVSGVDVSHNSIMIFGHVTARPCFCFFFYDR